MIREGGHVWLTAAEAADKLGVSESTALADAKGDQLESRDRGPGRRPRWLILADDVERIVRAGGRVDQRAHAGRHPVSPTQVSDEATRNLRRELEVVRSQLTETYGTVAQLQAEVARLRVVARNANVALQVQTESLQQYLVEEPR